MNCTPPPINQGDRLEEEEEEEEGKQDGGRVGVSLKE